MVMGNVCDDIINAQSFSTHSSFPVLELATDLVSKRILIYTFLFSHPVQSVSCQVNLEINLGPHSL